MQMNVADLLEMNGQTIFLYPHNPRRDFSGVVDVSLADKPEDAAKLSCRDFVIECVCRIRKVKNEKKEVTKTKSVFSLEP